RWCGYVLLMRSRMLLGLSLVGAIAAWVVLVGSAGASRDANTTSARRAYHVKVPLPQAGQAEVSVITVKATAPQGKSVGSLNVSASNAGQVEQASADAVAKVVPPSSGKRRA